MNVKILNFGSSFTHDKLLSMFFIAFLFTGRNVILTLHLMDRSCT